MSPEKQRADSALVDRGLMPSREKAQAAIMAGSVYVGERKILKASEPVKAEEILTIKPAGRSFVSRGALKLQKALKVFRADLKDRIVMDLGASTGGFTEVCLLNGARKVYAIDVGYGQLDWKLRNDPRVCVMERTNARYIRAEQFDPKPEIAVMDVSFISIRLILPAAAAVMGDGGVFYTLIKPQFEAGRDKVGKKGVVRDTAVHEDVINGIAAYAGTIGWTIEQADFSPITGPEGNIEFLAKIVSADHAAASVSPDDVHELVRRAHEAFSS